MAQRFFNTLQRRSLTLSVCGTADDISELGFQARVGGAGLAEGLIASRAE